MNTTWSWNDAGVASIHSQWLQVPRPQPIIHAVNNQKLISDFWQLGKLNTGPRLLAHCSSSNIAHRFCLGQTWHQAMTRSWFTQIARQKETNRMRVAREDTPIINFSFILHGTVEIDDFLVLLSLHKHTAARCLSYQHSIWWTNQGTCQSKSQNDSLKFNHRICQVKPSRKNLCL